MNCYSYFVSRTSDSSPGKDVGGGTQVFFFPDDEGGCTRLPPSLNRQSATQPKMATSLEDSTDGSHFGRQEQELEESIMGLAGMRLGESVALSESGSGSETLQPRDEGQEREDFPETRATNSDDEFCIIDDPGIGISVIITFRILPQISSADFRLAFPKVREITIMLAAYNPYYLC